MALGANDMQTAGCDHHVMLLLPLSLDFGDACFFLRVAQLSVVAYGSDVRLRVAAEHDVGTATGHIGGNGNHPGATGLHDDLRFALMLLGVEHLMRQIIFIQQA